MNIRRWGGALVVVAVVCVALYVPRTVSDPSAGDDSEPAQEAVAAETATLAWVSDGDTLKVDIEGGSRASVRLIGIDTPETHAGLECGGPEATAAMQRMVQPGARLQLQIDPTQAEVDRYGRLLRYALADGTDLGRQQVVTGAATVYVYDRMFVKGADYREAQDAAKAAPRGIWKNC